LIDHCPSYVNEEILGFLRDARVRVITWGSHTTQSFHHDSVITWIRVLSPPISQYQRVYQRGRFGNGLQQPFKTMLLRCSCCLRIHRESLTSWWARKHLVGTSW
jgi:hypothetical protein